MLRWGWFPREPTRTGDIPLTRWKLAAVEEHYLDLLYDPQTSGGLLISRGAVTGCPR